MRVVIAQKKLKFLEILQFVYGKRKGFSQFDDNPKDVHGINNIQLWDWEELSMLLVQISTILLEEKLTWVSVVHKNIKNNSQWRGDQRICSQKIQVDQAVNEIYYF